jgi:hypothetical protein
MLPEQGRKMQLPLSDMFKLTAQPQMQHSLLCDLVELRLPRECCII